ncbi:hypothetical protein [[Acholeplasma] multilocale]|uniref:hypothetical protein n=1 Tax=[Acholeplasma] multilocale TaxID=264638 RepID=UPI00047A8C47|nr:hypothetical protein [[Acholeplasma] multilocale]
MEKQVVFKKYKRESIVDRIYELMLHIGLPIAVEILINELWLHNAGFSSWTNLVIILSSVLITLLFSVCILTPIIAYIKNWEVIKLKKWLKANKLGWLRSDWVESEELKKEMKIISKDKYDEIVKLAKAEGDKRFYTGIFNLEQNFYTREIEGIHNEHDLAVGKMISHNLEIDKKNKLLKLDLTHTQEITIEARMENPNLKDFSGRMQIVFNYQKNDLHYFYFINETTDEWPEGLFGVTYKVD